MLRLNKENAILAIFSLISALLLLSHVDIKLRNPSSRARAVPVLDLPRAITKVHINIGPNYTPIFPPNDNETAVLAVEPNIGVANVLREKYQKRTYNSRFFVINCAVSSAPLAGGIATFRQYNRNGESSSLSPVVGNNESKPAFASDDLHQLDDPSSPGVDGKDFVPVLDLESLLSAIPTNVAITFLKTDTQGHDLAVIKSASIKTLSRVERIVSETYIGDIAKTRYKGVENNLNDWIPYMKKSGFYLADKAPTGRREWDATWLRSS